MTEPMGLFGDITEPMILKYLIALCAPKNPGGRCTKSDHSPSLRRVVRPAGTLAHRQGGIFNAQGRAAACRALLRACRGQNISGS